jgi:hypothetical protein
MTTLTTLLGRSSLGYVQNSLLILINLANYIQQQKLLYQKIL